jgi:hypothetical protein
MTAITFPTDPANGSLYTAPNGAVYIWDGEKWMVNSTTYTGTALTEITQDRVHSMFTHGENVGISFSYNDSTDKLIATVSGGGGGLSISDFGRGFVDTKDSGKITTNKLYNRPANLALNNHYELGVTDGGVVTLPDGSIINGATLKTIAGNYAGITAGPASPAGKDEDSWVWVDNNGATISTKTSTDNHTWHFDNNGDLNIPPGGTIRDAMTGDDRLRYYDPDDTDHWNEPTVNTISAALDELAARVTALQNYEIDGGNAYTPALGELLIDGNGD